MAGTLISTITTISDTAIGPVSVQTAVYSNYDIDDYVHSTAMSQAIQLQWINAASTVDQTLAAGRAAVNIEGVTAGGY
jgi:hypothetical protein